MSRTEHARSLAASDPVIADRNITVESISDDCTVVSMPIQPSMCNAYNIGHGAYIFMIADVAMSLASSVEDGSNLIYYNDQGLLSVRQIIEQGINSPNDKSFWERLQDSLPNDSALNFCLIK